MSNREARVVEREVGIAPMIAHQCSERFVSETERRIRRARQIVARQRELVARFDGRNPIAVALLHNFERSAALFEETLAAYQRREILAAGPTEAVHNCKPCLPPTTPNCRERAIAAAVQPDYEEQVRAVALIMEILRKNGYHCQLAHETSH